MLFHFTNTRFIFGVGDATVTWRALQCREMGKTWQTFIHMENGIMNLQPMPIHAVQIMLKISLIICKYLSSSLSLSLSICRDISLLWMWGCGLITILGLHFHKQPHNFFFFSPLPFGRFMAQTDFNIRLLLKANKRWQRLNTVQLRRIRPWSRSGWVEWRNKLGAGRWFLFLGNLSDTASHLNRLSKY